ncbi:MAG: sigma-54-dependent Fis family transcriptional regulator [Alphaproteobacteria bacterium]|nr:sigma-54-dependent Fis family transcriptional regulator [Alphaproteobacteria bacterium]
MGASEVFLIIDESEADAASVRSLLTAPGRQVHVARSLREGTSLLDTLDPELVLVSLELSAMPGPRVVRMLTETRSGLHVVALTASPDPSVAVASVRAGAADYLGKPVDPDRLEQAVGRALRETRAERALRDTQAMVKDRYGFDDLLSRSPKMLTVFDQIRAVAPTNATVLVLGETGTGKELVARAIHDGSPRSDKPCISVNCGAFSEGLLESELFGHERGSFTGAVGRREGVFAMADGGTLFLDELGQTSLAVQVNLLRVLEEMSFRRVGGDKLVNVDVRFVAATNTDLEEAVATHRFREDLYYRLNVFPIRLPPLRERREDIGVLLRHFLRGAAREYGLAPPTIAADAMQWIVSYHWPGNVRQLRAMCERWVIVAQGGTVLKEMLPRDMVRAGEALDTPGALVVDDEGPLAPQLERVQQQLERAYLHRVLQRTGGHLQRAADHAGISRRTLYNKMKQYDLDPDAYRGP